MKNKTGLIIIFLILILMSVEVWGNLAKAQDNAQKINEGIDEAIAAHTADPDAHIEAGESINDHKVAPTIDHPAGSVLNDKVPPGEVDQSKLSDTEIQIYTAFESLDGWSKSGTGVTNTVLSVFFQTAASANDQKTLSTEPLGIGDVNTYVKDTFFQTGIKVENSGDILIYFMTGGFEDDDSDSGFGFKIEDGKLYAIIVKAVASSRTEYVTEISGITLTDMNIYKAFFDFSEGKIYFYVNGILKYTEDTNLPVDTSPTLFVYSIMTKENTSKRMGAAYFLYSREI